MKKFLLFYCINPTRIVVSFHGKEGAVVVVADS